MSVVGIGLYVKNSAKAVEVYKEAFGLELGYNVRNDDGTYFHSELDKNGEPALAVVEGDGSVCCNNPVQLGFTFEDKAQLDKAFELLSKGGTVLMDKCVLPWSPYCAEVTDEFGIRWYLTLNQHRPDDDFSPEDCK